MKKWLCSGVVLAILIGIGIARADDIDNQIQLKETQLQSLQWEFNYLQEMVSPMRIKLYQERLTTIQVQAQKLQVEIDALKKKQEEKKKENEKKIVK